MASKQEISSLFKVENQRLVTQMQRDNEPLILQIIQKNILALTGASATFVDFMQHVPDATQKSHESLQRQIAQLEESSRAAKTIHRDDPEIGDAEFNETREIVQLYLESQLAFLKSSMEIADMTTALSKLSAEAITQSFATLLRGSGSWEAFVAAIKCAGSIGVGFIPIAGGPISALLEIVKYFDRHRTQQKDTNAFVRSLRVSTESYTKWALFIEILSDLRTHSPIDSIADIDQLFNVDRLSRASAVLTGRLAEIEQTWSAPAASLPTRE